MQDLPAQGYLLASESRLYVVTSRDTPLVLDAATGQRLHKVKGGTGGTYALLTGDTLLYGPGKTGDVNQVGGEQSEVLASFQGNHMIVDQPLSFLQSRDELSALDPRGICEAVRRPKANGCGKNGTEQRLAKLRAEKKETEAADLQAKVDQLNTDLKRIGEELKGCLKWRTKCNCPYALVLADGVLIGGGDGEVIAVNADDGERLWTVHVPGKVYGLAVSGGKLFASTDEGAIHCFAEGSGPPGDVHTAASKPQVRHQPYPGPIATAEKVPAEIHGPFTEFIAPRKVRITWDSHVPMTSTLAFGADMSTAQEWQNDQLTTEHQFVVEVQDEVVYRFQVGGVTEDDERIVTDSYRFDSYLNYFPQPVPAEPWQQQVDDQSTFDHRKLAKDMLTAANVDRGYALVIGAGDGRLAYELACASGLKIVVIEADAAVVRDVRRRLDQTGLYGSRISVHHRTESSAGYGPFLANLVVWNRKAPVGSAEDWVRLYASLRPAGGTMIIGAPTEPDAGATEDTLSRSGLEWNPLVTSHGNFWVHKRSKLPSTGEWDAPICNRGQCCLQPR